jgi:tetratricopeptide (TPR) repeat protein
MKQKIEWYKEVLELEPGSRVFFPLAKLLAADGQADEAIRSLRQGLLRHPDHVEARLLLVELLFLQNAGEALTTEIHSLGAMLVAYPGFWQAWSSHLSSIPDLHDASLAMRFFAAAIQGRPVSWGEIIEHGLKSVLGDAANAVLSPPAFAAHTPSAQEETAMRRSAPPESGAPATQQSGGRPQSPTVFERQPEKLPAEASPVASAPLLTRESDGLSSPEDSDDIAEEEPEETFSIRTRSMAEVLAEQGDITGALDIYQELMQTASTDEKRSLMARSDELAHRLHAGSSGDAGQTEEKSKTAGGENTKIINLLESLAQRLEARAR